MANTVPGYNRSYLVQQSDDDGRDYGVYIIDQYINPRDGEKGLERVRNQVEKHLFHQFRKTGLHHTVIFEGEKAAAILIANDTLMADE